MINFGSPCRRALLSCTEGWGSDSSPRSSADSMIPRVWHRQIQDRRPWSRGWGGETPVDTGLVVEECVVNLVAVTLSQPP